VFVKEQGNLFSTWALDELASAAMELGLEVPTSRQRVRGMRRCVLLLLGSSWSEEQREEMPPPMER
jgi:hypothetical protein